MMLSMEYYKNKLLYDVYEQILNQFLVMYMNRFERNSVDIKDHKINLDKILAHISNLIKFSSKIIIFFVTVDIFGSLWTEFVGLSVRGIPCKSMIVILLYFQK